MGDRGIVLLLLGTTFSMSVVAIVFALYTRNRDRDSQDRDE